MLSYWEQVWEPAGEHGGRGRGGGVREDLEHSSSEGTQPDQLHQSSQPTRGTAQNRPYVGELIFLV